MSVASPVRLSNPKRGQPTRCLTAHTVPDRLGKAQAACRVPSTPRRFLTEVPVLRAGAAAR